MAETPTSEKQTADDAATEPRPPRQDRDEDAVADEASEESFPGSDPPATWAGPDDPDRGE